MASAQSVNQKAIQSGFNPQPNPPIVNPAKNKATQSTKASNVKKPGESQSIIVVNSKPGSKGDEKGLLPAVKPAGKR